MVNSHLSSIGSLDALVVQTGVSSVDVIKLDVEGSEMNALLGSSESLDRYRPDIVVEILNDSVELEIRWHLTRLGYRKVGEFNRNQFWSPEESTTATT